MFATLAARLMTSQAVADGLSMLAVDPSPGVDHPQPGNAPLPGDLNAKIGVLMGWGLRFVYVACFFGFLMAAGKMAIAHRRGEEINFVGLGTTAAACLIGGSAGAIADALVF
jgi:hypothetical protein